MQSTVAEVCRNIENGKIHKSLQWLECPVNAFGDILILRTYKSITEEPGVLFKTLIVHLEAETSEILDKKYRSRACITFAKSVNLSDARNESHYMSDSVRRRNGAVIKFPFLAEVIIQKSRQRIRAAIADCVTVKNPLIFVMLYVRNCPS